MVTIPASDLAHSPTKEVSIRMIDVDVRVVTVSKECDELVSEFLGGERMKSGFALLTVLVSFTM